ncbi:hypothetical protein Poly59_12000 [Rubripirellula reticaptiva]|uniref:Uncharacterized protein n=1 Tax=Rubripirellula reticaptiva TaxID=2528013 RepID=A0A5C6FF81_9BACT|nr:hypothetical protein Poly59_12000 [Rubripirellula reticaptiva]
MIAMRQIATKKWRSKNLMPMSRARTAIADEPVRVPSDYQGLRRLPLLLLLPPHELSSEPPR